MVNAARRQRPHLTKVTQLWPKQNSMSNQTLLRVAKTQHRMLHFHNPVAEGIVTAGRNHSRTRFPTRSTTSCSAACNL